MHVDISFVDQAVCHNMAMINPFQKPVTILGTTNGRLESKTFGQKQSDRLFHTFIIGQTGTGKSTLLLNMVRQDLVAGHGFCLIDPHGDLAEALKNELPKHAIYWNPSDPNCEVGYNVVSYVAEPYRPLVTSGIIETLKRQWSDAWGVRMEHLLRFSLLALLSRPDSTLKDIVPLLTKRVFRKEVLKHVTDPEVLKFWQDEFANMNYKNAADGVAPIANKLGAFLANPRVRKSLCEPEIAIRFRSLMDEGRPLIVNLSKGSLGPDISNILGGLIVTSISNAAFTRTNIHEKRRRPYFVYIDEFHAFSTKVFADMLSELRKYACGLILACQYRSQMSKVVYDAVTGNVGTLIVFRTSAQDAQPLSNELGWQRTRPQYLEPAHIADQPNYNFYIRLMVDGAKSQHFGGETLLTAESMAAKNRSTFQ